MTTSPQSSSEYNQTRATPAFVLLHPKLRDWLRTKNLHVLNASQQEAIRAILSACGDELTLSNPATAAIIEAVYMAILTQLATQPRNLGGFRVLHISPCRGSIDDHYERIVEMATLVDMQASCWHDDVSCADKARALRSPGGILLTTPEALEAFVLIRASQLPALFEHLAYVLIEASSTSFQSEQDRRIQNSLSHIDQAIESSPRRIILPTTIGEVRKAP